MQTPDLIQYIQDAISDQEEAAVTADELGRTVVQAVREYSRVAPDYAEVALATTGGTKDYAFPTGIFDVLLVADAAGTAVDFQTFGQKIRLAADPGTGTYTLSGYRYHQPDGQDNYPTVPDEHLDYVGELGAARLLDRFASDIAQRSDIADGTTTEEWPHNARTLQRGAAYKRAVVYDALSGFAPFRG
jgi:hypothetical protein